MMARDGSEPGLQRIGVLVKNQQGNGVLKRELTGNVDEAERKRYQALVQRHQERVY